MGSNMSSKSTSWGAYSSAYRLQPGQTLQGFAASLPDLPARIDFFVDQLGQGAYVYFGTLVPTPIPEPPSLLPLAAGLGWLAMRRRQRGAR